MWLQTNRILDQLLLGRLQTYCTSITLLWFHMLLHHHFSNSLLNSFVKYHIYSLHIRSKLLHLTTTFYLVISYCLCTEPSHLLLCYLWDLKSESINDIFFPNTMPVLLTSIHSILRYLYDSFESQYVLCVCSDMCP